MGSARCGRHARRDKQALLRRRLDAQDRARVKAAADEDAAVTAKREAERQAVRRQMEASAVLCRSTWLQLAALPPRKAAAATAHRR